VNLEQTKIIILLDFWFSIDIGANVNLISEKIVKIAYAKDNSISRVNGFLGESYSILGKVNLRIILNDGKKHKSILTEFIVTGSDWPDQFPEILPPSVKSFRRKVNYYPAVLGLGSRYMQFKTIISQLFCVSISIQLMVKSKLWLTPRYG
jgi:hypothetical protein